MCACILWGILVLSFQELTLIINTLGLITICLLVF
mgnify:CR=1 FL=1